MPKTLWIKEEFLREILAGRKTIEVRVAYSNVTRLQVGDQLMLNDQHAFVIRRIARYASVDDLLAHENTSAIAPHLSHDQLRDAINKIYTPEKQALGFVALEIVPAEK